MTNPSTSRSQAFNELRAAALWLSDTLHSLECNGYEIHDRLDKAWLRLSSAIEATHQRALSAIPSEIGMWHPVSEQPKNEEAMFIVRDQDGQHAFAARHEGKWEHVTDDDCGDIAHWTPLPEAPK